MKREIPKHSNSLDRIRALENENKRLEEENKKLKKERDLYKARNEELNENCFGLSKENKKLKEKIERWEKCFKKGYNPQDVRYLMEEDTLQELKDIGEI